MDIEKALNKIQYCFIIRIVSEAGGDTFSPSTQEAEEGRSQNSAPA